MGNGTASENLMTAYQLMTGWFGDALPDAVGVAAAPNKFMEQGLPPAVGTLLAKVQLGLGLKSALDADADLFERIDGVISAGGGATSALAGAAQSGSSVGAAGGVGGAAATAAGFFSIASLTLMQFGLLGAPVHEGVNQARARGDDFGRRIGFAAGATGWTRNDVKNEFAQPYFGLPSGKLAERAHDRAFVKGLFRGWLEASQLTFAQANEYQVCVLRAAAEERVWFGGTESVNTRIVIGIATASREAEQACRVDAKEVVEDLEAHPIIEETDTADEGQVEPDADAVAEPDAVEPDADAVAEPDAVEPDADAVAQPEAVERHAVELDASEPDAAEPATPAPSGGVQPSGRSGDERLPERELDHSATSPGGGGFQEYAPADDELDPDDRESGGPSEQETAAEWLDGNGRPADDELDVTEATSAKAADELDDVEPDQQYEEEDEAEDVEERPVERPG